MDKDTIEVLESILHDVECLDFDHSKDDNRYYYDLIRGNLQGLMVEADDDMFCLIGSIFNRLNTYPYRGNYIIKDGALIMPDYLKGSLAKDLLEFWNIREK